MDKLLLLFRLHASKDIIFLHGFPVTLRIISECGVVISEAMLDHTTIMRAPSGELTTQYDLDDCEQAGLIKFDFLNTKTLGMIQLTFEELIKRGRVEWQGSLRKPYNKFLHPDVIDMENPIYFDKLNNGELISAFQFETGQGLKTLNAIKPHSLLEVANANTLMRLMSDGEQPLDKYVRFKNNPIEWEQEMVDFGLNEEERQLSDILPQGQDHSCISWKTR